MALSALLVAGIIAGSLTSIARNRYSDSTQNFANFLESIYSSVSNPSSNGSGRSGSVIYGKLVVFGSNFSSSEHPTRVFVYDIIGDAISSTMSSKYTSFSTLDLLGADESHNITHSNIFVEDSGEFVVENSYFYDAQWAAEIEDTEKDIYKSGALIIARSPATGKISTYYADADWRMSVNSPQYIISEGMENAYYLANLINRTSGLPFSSDQINFCIDSDDVAYAGNQRVNIRIAENATNSSAVQIYSDEESNLCEK